MEKKISKAVKTLTSAIKKDEGFYQCYKASIAMAFKDEFDRCDKKYKNRKDIHDIANKGADNFLKLWISK